MWCIPPKQDAAFVCAMEQALDGYARRPDPSHPVVRMDETTKQCVKETRTPQPTAPGRAARYDAEYERNGVAHLLLYYAPLENGRRVDVKADHVATTWAEGVRQLVEEDFPEADAVAAETAAWLKRRNTHAAPAQWPFTTEDARIKLHGLYPSLSE